MYLSDVPNLSGEAIDRALSPSFARMRTTDEATAVLKGEIASRTVSES